VSLRAWAAFCACNPVVKIKAGDATPKMSSNYPSTNATSYKTLSIGTFNGSIEREV
jgi:hypothetical protein